MSGNLDHVKIITNFLHVVPAFENKKIKHDPITSPFLNEASNMIP